MYVIILKEKGGLWSLPHWGQRKKMIIYQLTDKGMVGYPLIISRDQNIRRGRRPSWIFVGEIDYQGISDHSRIG